MGPCRRHRSTGPELLGTGRVSALRNCPVGIDHTELLHVDSLLHELGPHLVPECREFRTRTRSRACSWQRGGGRGVWLLRLAHRAGRWQDPFARGDEQVAPACRVFKTPAGLAGRRRLSSWWRSCHEAPGRVVGGLSTCSERSSACSESGLASSPVAAPRTAGATGQDWGSSSGCSHEVTRLRGPPEQRRRLIHADLRSDHEPSLGGEGLPCRYGAHVNRSERAIDVRSEG